MKILFLDVDGVLNCSTTFQRRHNLWKATGQPIKAEEFAWPLGHLDEELIPRLNTIIEQTGCKIVVSSSWRISEEFPYFGGWLVRKGFKYPDSIIGRTGTMTQLINCRGEEIKAWLVQHPEVTHYAILDDDVEDITPVHPNNTVQTSGKEGLTEERAQAAISLLLST
jgi:hypothetical protein